MRSEERRRRDSPPAEKSTFWTPSNRFQISRSVSFIRFSTSRRTFSSCKSLNTLRQNKSLSSSPAPTNWSCFSFPKFYTSFFWKIQKRDKVVHYHNQLKAAAFCKTTEMTQLRMIFLLKVSISIFIQFLIAFLVFMPMTVLRKKAEIFD